MEKLVKFEGQNDSWGNAETIGHGLSSAPTCMVLKNIDKSDEWQVFYSDYGSFSIGGSTPAHNSLVWSNSSALYTNQSYKGWGGVMPTSTVFTVDGNNANGAGETILCYCFANCSNYIKSGFYKGNANATNSPVIYTGFRPEWLVIRYLGSGESWIVIENASMPYNKDRRNYRFGTNSESSGSTYEIDLLSNGFKPRTTWEGLNGNGYIITYLAIGQPFKYGTAV